MKLLINLFWKSGLTFIFLLSIISQGLTQNIGINTTQPQSALHVRSEASQNLFVDFEDQTSGSLQIINGPWLYNNVSYEGNYSTNSGYLTNGQRLMRHTIEVPLDSFAILNYFVQIDINASGKYSLPFEDTITGPATFDWELKTVKLYPGIHIGEWYVGNIQSPSPAGLIYIDNIDLSFYPISPVLKLESGNEGDGKVLTSDENGLASWKAIPTSNILADNDLDTKIEVELNPDEDIIRFYTQGNEMWQMEEDRLIPLNEAGNINIGIAAGREVSIGDGRSQSIAIGDSALHFSQLDYLYNIAIGQYALKDNETGTYNLAIGTSSLSKCIGGSYNTGIGNYTMYSNSSGYRNTAIGNSSLRSNVTGGNNTATGFSSLTLNTSGSFNTANGSHTIALNTIGAHNTASGYNALYSNITGNNNVAFGVGSLFENVSGSSNVAIGINSLRMSVDRSNLVAVGDSALFNNGVGAIDPLDGTANTAIGAKSLFTNSIGRQNTAIGYQSLFNNDSGIFNSGTGTFSLYENISGSYNTANGSLALILNTTGTNNTASGFGALYSNTSGNNNVAFGVSSLSKNASGNSNVGIGVSSLRNNIYRSNLVAVGDSSLYHNGFGATKPEEAIANTAIGSKSLYENTIGHNNTATGYHSMKNNDIGFLNTAMGTFALTSNISGNGNVALGSSSIYSNISGNNNVGIGRATLIDNTSGNENIAIGIYASEKNESGNANISIGTSALASNKDKSYNIAIGDSTLFHNGTGGTDPIFGIQNIAIGSKALLNNTDGYANTALGFESSFLILTGSHNTALGRKSLFSNFHGDNNTSVGSAALYLTTGSENTALGSFALGNNTTGSHNTAVGYVANNVGINLQNTTAIGYNSQCDESNTVRVGDNNVTSIGGIVQWTNLSDGRFKKNVNEDVAGLALINKLRPVTYTIDKAAYRKWRVNKFDHKAMTESEGKSTNSSELKNGFIAQEVEAAAKSLGIEFSGVDAPKTENGIYGLRYAAFTVPLVKAVQELSSQNEDLINKLDASSTTIIELEQKLLDQNKKLELYNDRLQKIEALIGEADNSNF